MSMSKKQLIKALTDIDDEHFKLARNFIENTDSSLESADLEERLVELADRGVPEAQHALSKLIFLGWFGERDYQASFAWCNLAADNNFAQAVDLLASFFLEGKGGSAKDVEHALYLKQKAAALGYIPSLRSLAILHATGTGVKQDARISFGYLKLAAEKKDTRSQFLLGSQLLEMGDSVSAEEGAKWIDAAASQGLPSALRRLADFYMIGSHGYPIDKKMSEKLREKADLE